MVAKSLAGEGRGTYTSAGDRESLNWDTCAVHMTDHSPNFERVALSCLSARYLNCELNAGCSRCVILDYRYCALRGLIMQPLRVT